MSYSALGLTAQNGFKSTSDFIRMHRNPSSLLPSSSFLPQSFISSTFLLNPSSLLPSFSFLFMAREASEQDQGSSSSIGQAQGSSSSIGQAQGLSFSVEARVMLPFLSILGFLLEVKSQGNNISLFEKHKAIIYSFVVAISIYMGTIFVGKKLETEAIRPIQLLSGTIAPILLLLILVPNFGWLLLVLWVFLAAKMAWDCLSERYHYPLSQEDGRISNLLARLKTLISTSVKRSQDDLV